MSPKLKAALAAALPLLLTDCVTKWVAVADLVPHQPRRVWGTLVRFTLHYNSAAGLGLSLGSWSRWGFAAVALVMILTLILMLRRAPPRERMRAAAIGCLLAGAIGNLFDRLRWERGGVDFIDIGIGTIRFWTFNVADLALTVGTALLVLTVSLRPRAPNPSS